MAEQSESVSNHNLSAVVIPLLKGVIYEAEDATRWSALLALQSRVRDYVAVIGLELELDEAEGYAYLHSRPEAKEDLTRQLPRLIARRPLSFSVSLLLALLRKKLAESDAAGGETRLVLTRDQTLELIRIFVPQSTNEAKLISQIETHINKIVELGFIRRLNPASGSQDSKASVYEVQRILKAFVDAQWLSEFDARLAAYQSQLADASGDVSNG